MLMCVENLIPKSKQEMEASVTNICSAQFTGAAEYTNYVSVEG